MKCEIFSEKYLALDNRRKPDLLMKLHALFCPHCREEAHYLEGIYRRVSDAGPDLMPRDLTASIMLTIKREGVTYGRKVSFFNWISAEVIIVLSIVLVQFSDSLPLLKEHYGRELELPLYLIMGVLITIFSASLVNSQMKNALDLKERFFVWLNK